MAEGRDGSPVSSVLSWLLAFQLEVYTHLVQVGGGHEVAQWDLLLFTLI